MACFSSIVSRTAVLIIATLLCLQATAQEAANPLALTELLKRAEVVSSFEKDELESLSLRADAINIPAALAGWNKDMPAMRLADQALARLITAAQDSQDNSTRDRLMADRCDVLAAMGQWEAAGQLAWEIPRHQDRSFAMAIIAVARARSGDAESYQEGVEHAFKLVKQLILIDERRDPEERVWPSYMAESILQLCIDEVVLAGARPNADAIQELKRLGERVEALSLKEGAQAAAYSLIAYGYARLGSEQQARAWIKRAEPGLKKELEYAANPDPDNPKTAWLYYGAEPVLYQQWRAYCEMGDLAAAKTIFTKLADAEYYEFVKPYFAIYLADQGEAELASTYLKDSVQFAFDQEATLIGPEDPEVEDWMWITSSEVYWHFFVAAESATNMNDQAQLARLRGGAKNEFTKLAIDCGVAWAAHRPFIKADPPE